METLRSSHLEHNEPQIPKNKGSTINQLSSKSRQAYVKWVLTYKETNSREHSVLELRKCMLIPILVFWAENILKRNLLAPVNGKTAVDQENIT